MPKQSSGDGSSTADPKFILDRYKLVEVHRSEMKNAPYNPRRPLTDSERDKLRSGMTKFGFLGPPVWNSRTGNIVGGHARMRVADLLNGTKDYRLQVAAVDLSEVEEREANILLNNANAAADYDLEKLAAMFSASSEYKLDIAVTGFDVGDLVRLFGEDVLTQVQNDALDELAQKLRAASETYERIRQNSKNRDGIEFFTILVWKDDEARLEAHDKLGMTAERYQDGRTWLAKFGSTGEPEDTIQ